MYLLADIDNKIDEEAKAVIKFFDEEKDIFKCLSDTEKKKIVKDYNISRIINVNQNILKTYFKEGWKRYELSKKIINELYPTNLNYFQSVTNSK